MYMSEFLKHVLKDKVPDSTEIELHLFEFCNLSCSFCGQDHDSEEGLNTVSEKAKQVIDFMQKSGKTSHIVNSMGGEIFNDLVPDETLSQYWDFYTEINDWCISNNHKVRFNWVTNLIFQKSERVLDLITRMRNVSGNAYISTSYDFAGRGLDINKTIQFDANLKKFGDWITVIGFVMTKPAIRKILTKTDKFFSENLYKNYTLYFDYYVPELRSDKNMPSEQEMLDCMLFIAKNYPNIYPIKDLIVNEHNKMTCYSMNKVTILPSGKEVTCRYLDYEPVQFINKIDYKSNSNIIEAHLERNKCLGCKWFDRCAFRCFVQADWAELERTKECLFREFFNQVNELGMLKYGSNN
jgi:MoaA/NifB/PqqE/SkfB family radical SAM enzyme